MFRLIVKNLPKIITEEKLKALFEEHGVITDIQLKYKDGKFRQFAFIGFQNEQDASKAIQSLNNTFVNTNKISVQACAILGDPNKPKSWSKHAADSNAFKKKHGINDKAQIDKEKNEDIWKESDTAGLLEKYKNDPLFDEFLEVHEKEAKTVKKLLTKRKISKEDATVENIEEVILNQQSNNEDSKLAHQDISDLDYMKELMKKPEQRILKKEKEVKVKEKIKFFTLKLKGLPYNCKKKDVKVFFKPLKPQSIRVPTKIHGIAFAGFKDEKKFKKALLKDRSFISGHQISVMIYNDHLKKKDEVEDTKKSRWASQEQSLLNEEGIAESGRIFVRNLAYMTTEDDLRPLFEKYGPLTEMNLPVDTKSRKMKGFGTITFLMPEHAVRAYSDLDGTIFQGRMLHLLPAKGKDNDDDKNSEDTSSFKQKKAAKQKSQSGMSHNWNALFLGHDAVAEVVADTFGTTKEAVVGPDGKGSAAVRLALGETQIIAQTRKYLEQEGVVLDAFSSPTSKRSKTTILVKNLPSRTILNEIREIFEKYGVLGRVILPPSGITAIVEFVEPSEARKAFTRLAYSKFKNMPLYLEWAPENTLQEKPPQTKIEAPGDLKESKSNETEDIEENNEESEDEEPESDTTIFVKNLNFKTTDDGLKKHFANCGKIHYATVATKKDKNNPGQTLSMGYGFVRFKIKAAADKALKTLQQSVLDGKSLELKRSERTLQTDVQIQKKTAKKTKQNGTKILVRNVPFQAHIREIQELFSVFGELKALRMPKKMSGESHRGFAFVDYVTASDAKKAFEALSQSTHLFGRRLVLEWAEQEGEEKSGKRSSEHFQQNDKTKKSKKGVFDMENL